MEEVTVMHSVVTTATGSTDMGVEEPDMVMSSAGQGTAVGLLRWKEGRRGVRPVSEDIRGDFYM
jgi:hypothetical protein